MAFNQLDWPYAETDTQFQTEELPKSTYVGIARKLIIKKNYN